MASTKMHLSLNVADIDRSVTFYAAFFGVPVNKRREGYANFDIAEPPLKLSLEQRGPAEPARLSAVGALNHLGILVETSEQVWAAKERLIGAGLATFDEKDTTCCYARQDKIWVHDPDGNMWEVYALLEDSPERGTSRLPMLQAAGEPCCSR